MMWLTESVWVRRLGPVLLAVTLTFSAVACDSGDDVDETEQELREDADEKEDELEDTADEIEEDLKDG
jgi:hypothetical protein